MAFLCYFLPLIYINTPLFICHLLFIISRVSCVAINGVLKQMGKIPIEEIKKDLALAQLPGEAIEEVLQVLSVKCLTELEGQLQSLVDKFLIFLEKHFFDWFIVNKYGTSNYVLQRNLELQGKP